MEVAFSLSRIGRQMASLMIEGPLYSYAMQIRHYFNIKIVSILSDKKTFGFIVGVVSRKPNGWKQDNMI